MKTTIILRAPVFSRSGYGSHSRDIALALYDSGKYNVSIAPTGWGGSSTTDNLSQDVMDKLTLMCNNQIQNGTPFVFVHVGVPNEFEKIGVKNIGITAGIESTTMQPNWVEGCNRVDAVIVPSTFTKELFERSGVKAPVHVAGEGVDIETFNNTLDSKLDLDFSTSFNFLGAGQWMQQGAGEDRKGIGLLIHWFCETFQDRQDVGLVLKTHTINNSSPDFVMTRRRIEALKGGKPFPKIHLIHGDMSDGELAQLYTHPKIKAFVSATSGEGWFRPLAESIASDLPVLVPGWSGYMDYMRPELSTLFEYEMKNVPNSVLQEGLFPIGSQWAFPKEEDVKRKLRRCYEGYSVAKERAVKFGADFRQTWSKKQTDAKLVEAFDLICDSTPTSVGGISVEQV